VVVVGGGLAGIAASMALAREGQDVALVERRPFLGGRAFSFADPETGATIDNGQHVLTGACTRLRALLTAIGSPPRAFTRQSRLEVPILDSSGRLATITAAPLPPPFHLLAGLARYRHFSPRESLVTARHVAALIRTRGSARAGLDPVPLGEWLERRGAARCSIERFWEPLVRPALNVPVARANTPLTAFFLERALWGGRKGGALWLPATGLSEAVGRPALRALRESGVEVRLATRVREIAAPAGRVEGIELADGGTIPAGRVVAAVPPRALGRLLGGDASPPGSLLGASPIVNVYLWYDRPVLPVPFAGTFGGPLQWVFDRTRLLGREAAGGECLGVSLSAADDAIEAPREELADRIDAAVERFLPARGPAHRLAAAVVKEPRATFLAGPGLAGRRSGPAGPVPGLVLAGDWTDTGWPATMEGAVRSGEAAARAVMSPWSSEPASRVST